MSYQSFWTEEELGNYNNSTEVEPRSFAHSELRQVGYFNARKESVPVMKRGTELLRILEQSPTLKFRVIAE